MYIVRTSVHTPVAMKPLSLIDKLLDISNFLVGFLRRLYESLMPS